MAVRNVYGLLSVLDPTPLSGDLDHLAVEPDRLRTPLYVLVLLLRELKHQASVYALQRVSRDERWTLRVILYPLVEEVFSDSFLAAEDMHRDSLEPLSTELLRLTSRGYKPLVLARVLADVIEAAAGDKIFDQLRYYYGLGIDGARERHGRTQYTPVLRPGDPVPVCDGIFGGHYPDSLDLGTHPRRLPRWRSIDRAGRILLAPAGVESLSVRLNFDMEHELDDLLAGSRRVATIHPTTTAADYALVTDGSRLTRMRPRSDTDEPSGPSDEAYTARLVSGLDIAVGEGVGLVVYPELSLTETQSETVHTHWFERAGEDIGRWPELLVAGSSQRQLEEGTVNATSIAGETGRVDVPKSVPLVHWETSADTEPRAFIENVPEVSRPNLSVFCGTRMTMVVCLGSDVLLDALRDVARDLDVSLVVVPAMTPRVRVHRGLTAGHVSATRGVVILADAIESADEGRALALVGHPRFEGNVLPVDRVWRERHTSGDPRHERGGVAVIDLDSPEHSKWIPILDSDGYIK